MEPPQQDPVSGARSGRLGGAFRGGSRKAASRVRKMFTSRGAGFRRLAETHSGSVAGDALIALALAQSLFFQVPSAEARENVALYLLVTLAPFSVLGPFLGGVFERFPAAYRGGLVLSAGLRAVVAIMMIIWQESLWFLLPLAFVALVLSRFHGIARSSVLPVVLERRSDFISANAQLARAGVLAGAAVVPAILGVWLLGTWFPLVIAAAVFTWSARAARLLPSLASVTAEESGRRRGRKARKAMLPRPVRLARFATAGVRFLNGFLLLLVAFAFRDVDASVGQFGTLLGAAGVGFFAAALITPVLEKRISEEPMVVAGLAVEAGAAFVAGQVFGLPAAALLAAAAGFAWGTAKFGFDGLLQASVPIVHRGRAFTNSETFFQLAWVLGAIIPVVPSIPPELGLSLAGIAALVIQVIYVSAVLVPVVAQRRQAAEEEIDPEQRRPDVLDLM
ncbi:MAG: hypothetical protein ACE5GC_01445 [Acidimicrobiia bacterium]